MVASNISRNSIKVGWYEDVAEQNRLDLNSVPEAVLADCKSGIDVRSVLSQNIELSRELVTKWKHFEFDGAA